MTVTVMRAVLLLLALCSSAHGLGLADEALDGPSSVYTGWLADVLKDWPASRPGSDGTASLQLSCVATPSNDRYVGMLQQMTVEAPLVAVEKVLDDVPRYKDLFPGVVDVHVLPGSRVGRRYVTVWEQRVPVFFLPNAIYELANLVDKTNPGLRIYRYKLRRGQSMLASDGMVVLEELGAGRTRFTEYDFFNAQWGPLPASAVWRESLRGAFVSDMAIKLRAENPDWNVERVAAEAGQRLGAESERMEQCYQRRQQATLSAANEASPRHAWPAPSPSVP
jgi:hypothetical protein